jgi:UDP-N-acetylglucosamine diphosphorylase/glucosamine-1-phosphate N-acetyltransferase
VLHQIAGRTLIDRVLDSAAALQPATTTLVLGHAADDVREHFGARRDVQVVIQEPQLGTGHALLQTAPVLRWRSGMVILLSGDVPLLTAASLRGLVQTHQETKAAATVLTATVDRPYGYGRIVRSQGRITRIVEERDASAAQRRIQEINSGIYAFELATLYDALESIGADNAQDEYYLPDLIAIYRRKRRVVATYTIPHAVEIRGINSRSELAEVTHMVRQQKKRRADGRRRHADRSGHDLRGHRRRGRPRHGSLSVCLPRARHEDRRGVRDSLGLPHRQLDHR